MFQWLLDPSVVSIPCARKRRPQEVNVKIPTYVENALRLRTTRVGIFLAQGYQLLGQPLRFFGFGPRRLYRFVGYEGGDEVAEEGLAVRGLAV